jgi:selenocysteine lyase/cysteine desulfurase
MRYTSRVGGIRISTHLYNDHDDVDRLLQVMRRLLGRRAHEAAGAARG